MLKSDFSETDPSSVAKAAKQLAPVMEKFSWFLIGIGFLFPYNSVVTAVDFFALIYFQSIDFALGWLLLLPSLLILCITLKYGYIGTIYQRIIGTFLLEAILTIIIPLVRNVYVLFVSTFILGCLSAVLQGTLFSLLGFLGSDLMSITQTGLGFSGVIVGLIRICTKIWIPADIRISTYLYFLMAFLMVLVSIFLYVCLLHPSQRVQSAIFQDQQKNHSLHALKQSKSKLVEKDAKKRIMLASSHERVAMLDENKREHPQYDSCSSVNGMAAPTPLGLVPLFCASWKCQIAVFLNYTVTLSLFPGVMSLMQWHANDDHWFAVIQIFIFNLLDTIGKKMTGYSCVLNAWSYSEYSLLIASVCRLCFIPLFMMCIRPQIFSWQMALFINAAMGITNGVVGTSGFCLGPLSPKVPEHEKGRVAQMLAVALTAGLVVGSSTAFAINYVMLHLL